MRIRHNPYRIGLALGAGAARGVAHLGVLQVLDEAGISVDLIAGSSFGSFVAGCYACNPDARLVTEQSVAFAESSGFRSSKFDFIRQANQAEPGFINTLKSLIRKGVMYSSTLTSNGFITAEAMAHNVAQCLPDRLVQETEIPFVAVSTDVMTGEEILINRGPIRRAVHASCAIPGVFRPVAAGDKLLVDGASVQKIPVLPAYLMGADFVIAVDVSSGLADVDLRTGADMLIRNSMIEGHALRNMQARMADFLIEPDLGDIHWADFRKPMAAVARGADAARKAIPRLLAMLDALPDQMESGYSPGRKRAMPFLADHQMQYFEMPAEEVVEPGAPEEETMKEESGPLEAVEIQE
ncbi:MAG: patatin-like phospholipase family protein [Planctomycetota bacterium]|nr:patatin-like phospholipase family protein [Planctomycetota bacterium]MDP6504064.1 patatin-like phospholipase family protein [Planctomycetota bacterium]